MTDPLKPELALLVKLGSIAIHLDEMLSDKMHEYDQITLQGLLQDKEVIDWLEEMDRLALIPKKR